MSKCPGVGCIKLCVVYLNDYGASGEYTVGVASRLRIRELGLDRGSAK